MRVICVYVDAHNKNLQIHYQGRSIYSIRSVHNYVNDTVRKIAKIGNVEIARCENTKGVSCDARECVCMCVRRVRCL